MKSAIVKEYLHLNRKRRHLQRRIEKDQVQLTQIEKRINELKPIIEGGQQWQK